MPKATIEFDYSIGDAVRIVDIDRTGRVIALLRDNDGVSYRVTYWDNGQRRTEWLFLYEIKAVE